MIRAHGETYETTEQARDRIAVLNAENAEWGASDGRVTEILLVEQALRAVEPEPTWTVIREDFESPCDHPQCALLHRRFYTGSEWSTETVYLPSGAEKFVRVRGYHAKTNVNWVILRNGQRVGDGHNTKREALAQAARKPTT